MFLLSPRNIGKKLKLGTGGWRKNNILPK